MNNRLLVLSALLLVVAGSLIFVAGYVSGPVRSGQAGGGGSGALSSPAAWPERMADTPLLLTALANLPGSAGNPAILATREPTPENTPWPKKDTPTPWPSCPQPGGLCEWPEQSAPTRIVPTSTPYPVCVTAVPGDRCRMAATPAGG